jgi:hypothetical protein
MDVAGRLASRYSPPWEAWKTWETDFPPSRRRQRKRTHTEVAICDASFPICLPVAMEQGQTSHSYKSVKSVSTIELGEPCLGLTGADLVQPEPTVGIVSSPERQGTSIVPLPRRDPCSEDRVAATTDLVPKDDHIASRATNPRIHCRWPSFIRPPWLVQPSRADMDLKCRTVALDPSQLLLHCYPSHV